MEDQSKSEDHNATCTILIKLFRGLVMSMWLSFPLGGTSSVSSCLYREFGIKRPLWNNASALTMLWNAILSNPSLDKQEERAISFWTEFLPPACKTYHCEKKYIFLNACNLTRTVWLQILPAKENFRSKCKKAPFGETARRQRCTLKPFFRRRDERHKFVCPRDSVNLCVSV